MLVVQSQAGKEGTEHVVLRKFFVVGAMMLPVATNEREGGALRQAAINSSVLAR